MNYRGLHTNKRKALATILEDGKKVITTDSVVSLFGWDRKKTREFLCSLNRAGWIKLLKRGLYIPVPLELDDPSLAAENPMVLASYLYKDCYIGGWSAASFWHFTDQLFLKTWVITDASIRLKEETRDAHTYALKHTASSYFYGLYIEWFGQDKVYISDPHKTVIDFANFIDDYGSQSFIDVFLEYLKSEHKNLKTLLEYAEKTSNTTVFKRIGFVLEKFSPKDIVFINQCLEKVKVSATMFAPKEVCKSFSNKWRMWIPKSMDIL
jgi:predicted transcriptional regulator of viral defense system